MPRILLCIILLFSTNLQALQISSVAVLSPSDRVGGISIGASTKVLIDNEANLNFSDITKPGQLEKFRSVDGEFIREGLAVNNLWAYIDFTNTGDKPLDIIIESKYPFTDRVELFQGDKRWLAGDKVSVKDRQHNYRFPAFKITLNPGNNRIYLKVKTQGSMYLPLFLWDVSSFAEYKNRDFATLGFLFGVFVIMLAYNGFLAFSFRSRTYSYYVLHITVMTLYSVASQGISTQFFDNTFGYWVANTGVVCLAALGMMCGTMFSYHFLQIYRHIPKLRLLFQLNTYSWVVLTVLPLVGSYNIALKLVSLNIVLTCFFLVFSGVVAALRGYHPARFYLLAWGVMALGNLSASLKVLGFLPFNFFTHWGVMLAGACELVLFSLALGDRVNYIKENDDKKIKKLNAKLKDTLDSVEATVVERTKTIKSILDNVKTGFLIVNRDLRVEAEFTQSCFELLKTNRIEGLLLSELLKAPPKKSDILNFMLEQAFSDTLPEAVSLKQVCSTFKLDNNYLKIEGGLIRDDQGVPSSVLITITDTTELRSHELASSKNRSLLKIISNKPAFREFIKFAKSELKLTDQEIDQKAIRGVLHTLKGSCLIYGLDEIANQIHKIEEFEKIAAHGLRSLLEQLKSFVEEYYSVIRVNWEEPNKATFSIDDSNIEELKGIFEQSSIDRVSSEGRAWVEKITAKKVKDVLGPIKEDIYRLADIQGKKINFVSAGTDTNIWNSENENVIRSLIHLLRNSVVHGIEENREIRGKPQYANISLSFKDDGKNFVIQVSDDGLGISKEELLQSCDMLLPENLDLEIIDILKLHYHKLPKKRADLYSGRGVGVSTVISEVEKVNGRIDVVSNLGKGTTFTIKLPRVSPLSGEDEAGETELAG